MVDVHRNIAKIIRSNQDFLIVSHIRPDADAVGSVLGLGLALKKIDKTVQMVLPDSAEKFEYLPGSKWIEQAPSGDSAIVIVVDCSDPDRVGAVLSDLSQPDVVIDHHKTNLAFGVYNVVEPEQVATAAIIFDHLTSWGLNFDADIATCLLAGIVGDTIGFRTPNVDAELMRKAATLMDLGGDLNLVYTEELVLRSFKAVRYWGTGLNRLEQKSGMVWTSLTLADRENIGYASADDADLVNVLSSVREAKIALIFVEQPNHTVKVSWRTGPGLDVSGIAYQFGGGGHAAAAGADIEGSLVEIKKQVLFETQKLLKNNDRVKEYN